MTNERPHCMAREEYRYGRNFGIGNIDSMSFYIGECVEPHLRHAWLQWKSEDNTLDVKIYDPPIGPRTRPPKGERPIRL